MQGRGGGEAAGKDKGTEAETDAPKGGAVRLQRRTMGARRASVSLRRFSNSFRRLAAASFSAAACALAFASAPSSSHKPRYSSGRTRSRARSPRERGAACQRSREMRCFQELQKAGRGRGGGSEAATGVGPRAGGCRRPQAGETGQWEVSHRDVGGCVNQQVRMMQPPTPQRDGTEQPRCVAGMG